MKRKWWGDPVIGRPYQLFVVLALVAGAAMAERGTVSHRISGCDWFLVEAPSGYALMEWYGGWDPDKGDEVLGKFTTFGMKTIYDETADQEVKVWIDDFMLSKSAALEELYENCE